MLPGRWRLFVWAKEALDGDDDLADLRVGLHVAMRLDDLSEREGLGDTRLEVALLDMLEDVLLGLVEERGLGDELEERIAADSKRLAERGEERVRRGVGGECAVLDDDAATRSGVGECGEALAADGIEDDASALVAGDLVDA